MDELTLAYEERNFWRKQAQALVQENYGLRNVARKWEDIARRRHQEVKDINRNQREQHASPETILECWIVAICAIDTQAAPNSQDPLYAIVELLKANTEGGAS